MMVLDNFSLNISTVNGTGSQSANSIFVKSLFRSGYNVCGKNIFPSNIAGLPTNYAIRINKEGFSAYEDQFSLLLSMNKSTLEEDSKKLLPGSNIFYNSNLKLNPEDFSADHNYFGIPLKDLAKKVVKSPNLVKFLTNMTYVGLLTDLFKLDKNVVFEVVKDTFKSKPQVVELNLQAIEEGYKYSQENFDNSYTLYTPDKNLNADNVIMDGNTSAALGLVYGGCHFLSWYPITPSSSLAENYEKYSNKLLTNEDGEKNFACVQAEDELSAISMVLGAGWAGARAITPTSGPGLSLMAEAAGLSYYAEIPAVIWDVQRAGPSTGLPTRTLQGDLLSAAYLSHGDTEHVVLIPGTIEECFEFGEVSLNLSEELQTLIIVLTDLDLGMNQWISPQLKASQKKWQRGKVLDASQVNAEFKRYADIDNDGICYRTLPGTDNPAAGYFTRGTGHNLDASYTENPDIFVKNLERIKKKIDSNIDRLPQPYSSGQDNDFAIVCYGSTHPAVTETIAALKAEGLTVDFMRIKAFPFHAEVEEFLMAHKKTIVVDLNRDGQMHSLLLKKFPQTWDKVFSFTHFNGLPLDRHNLQTFVQKIISGGSHE